MIWVLVGFLFAATILLLERMAKQKAKRKRRFKAALQEYRFDFSKYLDESTAWREERARLLALSWPELRKACEAKTGKPCECATKYEVAQQIQGVVPVPPPPSPECLPYD